MAMNNARYYAARARTWGLGETSTGKEQVAINFQIETEGADFDHITWYGYFTDLAIETTIKALRNCGWEGTDLSDLRGLDAEQVELVIIEEPDDEGNPISKVRWVNRAGGLALKAPITGDKAKAFAASMRDKIKAIDATNGTPRPKKTSTAPAARPAPARSAPPQGHEPPPITDDDLPF